MIDHKPRMLKKEEDDEDDVILMEEASPPINTAKDLEEEEGKKTSHYSYINVSPDVVLASTGEERGEVVGCKERRR